MRVILGIIIGIVIIFNWGAIKDFFDEKLSNTSNTPAIENKNNLPEQNKNISPKAPEKADPFKEFK